jgi:hypothetical protein
MRLRSKVVTYLVRAYAVSSNSLQHCRIAYRFIPAEHKLILIVPLPTTHCATCDAKRCLLPAAATVLRGSYPSWLG